MLSMRGLPTYKRSLQLRGSLICFFTAVQIYEFLISKNHCLPTYFSIECRLLRNSTLLGVRKSEGLVQFVVVLWSHLCFKLSGSLSSTGTIILCTVEINFIVLPQGAKKGMIQPESQVRFSYRNLVCVT